MRHTILASIFLLCLAGTGYAMSAEADRDAVSALVGEERGERVARLESAHERAMEELEQRGEEALDQLDRERIEFLEQLERHVAEFIERQDRRRAEIEERIARERERIQTEFRRRAEDDDDDGDDDEDDDEDGDDDDDDSPDGEDGDGRRHRGHEGMNGDDHPNPKAVFQTLQHLVHEVRALREEVHQLQEAVAKCGNHGPRGMEERRPPTPERGFERRPGMSHPGDGRRERMIAPPPETPSRHREKMEEPRPEQQKGG